MPGRPPQKSYRRRPVLTRKTKLTSRSRTASPPRTARPKTKMPSQRALIIRSKKMSQTQPVVTLNQVKNHLRLCPSDADENNHLELLISAAVSHASQYLDRPIPWADKDGEPVPVPPDVQAAILLIIGDLYENREGQFVGIAVSENQTVQNLLHFHRIGLGI